MKVDHLIVGQGLAGSLLAWHLLEREKRVLVVDCDEPATSSKVAAGLVTPISGQQFSLPEQLPETLAAAKQVYWDIEERLGKQFFHHLRIARLFKGTDEVAKWQKRLKDPERAARYRDFYDDLDLGTNLIKAEHGAIEIQNGGWLNVKEFVKAIRFYLLTRIGYAIGNVDAADIVANPQGGIRWKNISADNVIFCQGWKSSQNRLFSDIPMNNAKGDILRIRCAEMADEPRILNRGGWVLPIGNGEFRAGSSYIHQFDSELPTPAGRVTVEDKVRSMIKPEFEVIGHESAIRPIIQRSRVFMGRHPKFDDILYFNGLGSKGVINAPEKTLALVEHLLDGKPLENSVDIRQQFDF